MNTTNAIYTERINRVTNFVQNNLDKSPSLDELASIACFSPYHFHRIFTAVTGETINFFTNRLRLEKSARLLKYSSKSQTDIALECGFTSSSTFSRSFKDYFGITPREYKKHGEYEISKIRKELFPIKEYILPMSDEELRESFPIEIKEFPQRRVALIRVIGGYEDNRVLNAFEKLVTWSKNKNLFETESIFGMSLDDPMVTPKEKYRYEACITIPDSFTLEADSEFTEMIMPCCKYAVTKVSGDIKKVATATHYLFEKWMLNSSYEPEHQYGLEIFLDKENVCNWNNFDLELCIPVKRLENL